jgi:hypothetical protein
MTFYAYERNVLDPEVYGQLRVGQSQSTVESRQPAREAGGGERPAGTPANPRGTDDCRFYRTNERSLSPAYRLCFSDGRLVHEDEVPVVDPRRELAQRAGPDVSFGPLSHDWTAPRKTDPPGCTRPQALHARRAGPSRRNDVTVKQDLGDSRRRRRLA